MQRLQQVDQFMNNSNTALREVYAPYAETPGLSSYYGQQPGAAPTPGLPPGVVVRRK